MTQDDRLLLVKKLIRKCEREELTPAEDRLLTTIIREYMAVCNERYSTDIVKEMRHE